MAEKETYNIEKLYTDCLTTDEESKLVEVQLKISLRFCDWCKFQAQPFYQELIQYLDNVKTPEQGTGPDARKSLRENKGYG